MHCGDEACYAKGITRQGYPSDVSDEERAFVSPYLTLMADGAPQREHLVREVFNSLPCIAHAGASG